MTLKGKKVVEPAPARAERPLPGNKCWRPPEDGWTKVNVDAAYRQESGEAGIGMVIRDHMGRILLSAWKKVHSVGSAEEVEALACKEGLSLAAEWCPGPTILESDCASVVRYLARPEEQRSESYFVIKETMRSACNFPKVVFRHIGRACNKVAHELAQLAIRLNHCAVWRNRCTVCVEHLVTQDVNSQVNQ